MVMPRLTDLRARVEQAKGRRESVRTRLTSVQGEISDLENEEATLDLVTELFRTMLDKEITECVKAVEKLQTEGMQAVFSDQDLSVRADIAIERGKVAVNLVTIQREGEGTIEGVSGDAFGGAVQTVQSVLMRIIVIYLRGMYPLLLLDESLPAFDPEYVVNMGKFLSVLCDRLGLDILLVTHNPSLVEAADRAYTIDKRHGSASFRLTKGKAA